MEPILYLAYGSNLNLEDMARRCPQAQVAGRARLEGWRLAFRGGGSGFYLTLEACPGSSVPVGVWESPEELTAIWREDAAFTPDYPQDRREADLARWHKAVERSRGWAG